MSITVLATGMRPPTYWANCAKSKPHIELGIYLVYIVVGSLMIAKQLASQL